MQHSNDKNKPKAEFTGEVKKLRERIAELEEVQKRSKDIEKIITIQRNLSLELNETRDLEKGLQLCLEAAIKVSGLDCGGVYLVDDASGDLHMKVHRGLPPDFVKSVACFDSKSAQAKLVMTGKPAYTRHQELDVPLKKSELSESLRAIAIIPIKYEEKVIACLNVASHNLDEVPVQSRTSLETIASQMGGAIAHLKTEEALKDSENKWTSLTQNTKDILLIVDKKGTIQYINKTFPPYTLEKTIGTDVYKYLPKEQHNIMSESLKKVFRTGKSDFFEVSSDIPEIGIIWFNTRVVPIKIEGKTSSAILITSDITERKKAEDALRLSEEKYRALFEGSANPIVMYDRDGTILMINALGARNLCLSQQECIGKSIFELLPDLDDSYHKLYRPVIDTGKEVRKEDCVELSSGKKWFWSILQPVSDAGCKRYGVLAISYDITEHKKAEESLVNERTYLKIMNDVSNVLNTNGSLNNVTDIILQGLNLHGADIGLLGKDNRLYIRGASTDLSKVFSNTARSLFFDFNSNATARNYFDSLDETKTLSINELFNLISDKGSLSSKIIKTLISELSKASVGETIIAPLKNSVGDRIGAVLLTKKPDQIFTMQERALVDSLCGTLALAIDKIIGEQKLQESEERYRLLLESISDNVYVLDREWRHVIVNDAAVDFVRMPKEKLIGGKLTELFPGVEETPFFKVFKKVMKTRKPDIVTNEYEFEDGRKNYYEVHVYPVPEGILCISRDITERKKAEEAVNAERDRAQKYLDIAGTMFVAINTEGIVTLINKKGCKMLGYEEDKIVGKNWFDNFLPERMKKEVLPVSHKLLSGEIEQSEYYENPILSKKGEERLIAWHNTVIKDENDNIIGHLSSGEDITEKKQVEETIKQERNQLINILDSMKDGIYIMNREHDIQYVNPVLQKEFGPPDGKKCYQYFHDITKPCSWCKNKKVFAGETVRWEWESKKNNKIYDLVDTPIKNPDGSISKLEIFHDITGRKQYELKINESRERLNSIFEHVQTGIVIIDEETHEITDLNPTAERIIGIKKEKAVGRSCHKFICPAEKGKCPISDLGQTIDNSERVLLGISGNEVPILKTVVPMVLDGRRYLVVSFVDLTEKKRAEAELKESEEKYRMIFDSANDIIAQVDKTGKILNVNDKVEGILGYKPEELIGKNFTRLAALKPANIPELLKISKDLIITGKKDLALLELTTSHKDGRNVSLEINTKVIKKNGNFVSLLSIIRDITERKQAEKEKNELESQLRQVEKMESIGQLAGGIAHDFNNQLGSIVGFADLIRENIMDDDKLYRYADNILITAKRSADITKQLLAFARKGKYKSVKVDVHKTIYEVISLLKHSIQKKIVIRQHLNANPSTTPGDPSQLQNAILNIAINARDAMPKGGDIVFATDTVYLDNEHVKTHQYVSPPGNYLQLCISDTGSGMDKDTQKHIFEPFFTTKEVGKGTGMGLAAVYGTINNHKGAIDVYSEPGRGTTFKIYLPLTTEGIGDETGFVKEADVIKGSAHILLADDEEMLGKMAKDMIETLGYKITICRNGKEAMKIYEKSWKDINLVILDMVMPEMDGKETYLEMKKVNPAIKVLLSSGYSITGAARELLSRGVDNFIQKPYRKAELSQKIAKVLNSD